MADELLHFNQRMTDYEALMWNIEKDPWLSSNIVGVTILDRPVDFADFRARMANACARIPRLRQRVQPGIGRFAPPTWVTDAEFDLDYHLRQMSLPEPGSLRQLLDLATDMMQDPFDRTRPLWQYVVFTSYEGNKGALFTKLHHTIADGATAIEMAAQYLSPTREQPSPDYIDLDELIARETTDQGGMVRQVFDAGGTFARRGLEAVSHAAGEVTKTVTDPTRIGNFVRDIVDSVKVTSVQLAATESKASPLWSQRSRHRRVEVFDIPFDDARNAAKRLGGKLNDFFVTGAVEGAARYHEAKGASHDTFTVSFAINTRSESAADSAGNEFTLVPVELPAGNMALEDRFALVHDKLAAVKEEVHGSGMMNALAGVMNLLPTSVVTTTARNRAAHVDFGTSNVPAAPIPLYMSGAEVEAMYPVGPVAGTAFIHTLVSYNGTLFVGMNIDADAINEPALLRSLMSDAYADLIQFG